MVGSSGSRISWPLRLGTTAALGLLILVFNHTSRVSPNTTAQVPSPNSWQSLLYTYATPSPALDPYAEHPIRQLMRTGREEWEAKVARQSRTLAAARVEYERRYSMLPPPGFDKWWAFAVANDVKLVDEYDSITAGLRPFFALSPTEIQARVLELGAKGAHSIIKIQNGRFLPITGGNWRPAVFEGWQELLEPVVAELPDLTAAVHLHDGPHSILEWALTDAYNTLVEHGRFGNEETILSDFPSINNLDSWTVRERTCDPQSPFRRDSAGTDAPVPGLGPAFVQSATLAMQYCLDPSIRRLHGATSDPGYISALAPSFTMAKPAISGDILWPATIQYNLNPSGESSFHDKPSHKIVWRGSLDGIHVHPVKDWRASQRFRLVSLATSNDRTSARVVRMTKKDFWGKEYQYDVVTTLGALNARYSNIRATGQPVQCDPVLCEHIATNTEFVERSSLEDMAKNRFVMDVDGNSYSARFRTHLMSNQVPLKSTIFGEWYHERIQPWVHYVPIRLDYSDLYNVLAYFDGDMSESREGHHDAAAAQMAADGREWAETHWRIVDMQAYLYRLMLEYARVTDPSRSPESRKNS